MALPVRMRADVQRDRAVLRHPNFHSLGLIAGALAMHRKPDAAAQSASLTLRTARWKALPIGKRERLIEHRFEFAAVVDEAARGLVRHRRGRNEIAPTHVDRIDAHFARGLVDQPLDHEAALPAWPVPR